MSLLNFLTFFFWNKVEYKVKIIFKIYMRDVNFSAYFCLIIVFH